MEPHISCTNLSSRIVPDPSLTPPFNPSFAGQRFKLKNCKTRPLSTRSSKIRCRVSSTGEIEAPVLNKHMFIFGMGFVGQYLAEQLKTKGWRVSGTCTSEEKRKKLGEKGYGAFIFKAEETMLELTLDGLEALYDATHIISSIPPNVGGRKDPVIFQLGDVLQQTISDGNNVWMGYLSST
ncbi:hypothetical protein KI387_021222, partial [Taxus chinensis]